MLSIHDLCLERHFQPVFRPLSFELAAGELIVITGPNGSGKTTVIRLLAGLIQPTSGTVSNGFEGLQYVGHESAVKAELSVRENLHFSAGLMGSSHKVESALASLGLVPCADQAGRTLSAGQRKRTALARLSLAEAGLWLLDEPYSSLDAGGIDVVDGLLDRHIASGGACVMATHGGHRPVMPNMTGGRGYEIALDAPAVAA